MHDQMLRVDEVADVLRLGRTKVYQMLVPCV